MKLTSTTFVIVDGVRSSSGAESLHHLVICAPNLGEAPREDVEGQRDWWTD